MESWTDNVYYSPELCGFELVDSYDFSSGSYEFDLRIVLKHLASGRYYMARDNGCSCPTPFEDFRSLGDLEDFDYAKLSAEQNEDYNEGDMTTRRQFLSNCSIDKKSYGYML